MTKQHDGRRSGNPFAPIDALNQPGWLDAWSAEVTVAFWRAIWVLPLTAAQLRLLLWLVAQTHYTGLLTASGRPGRRGVQFRPRRGVSFWHSQAAADTGLNAKTVGRALDVLARAKIITFIDRGHGAVRGDAAAETFVDLEVDPTYWDTTVFVENTVRLQRSMAGRAGGRASALKRAQQTLRDGAVPGSVR